MQCLLAIISFLCSVGNLHGDNVRLLCTSSTETLCAYLAHLPRKQCAHFVHVFHGDNMRLLCMSSTETLCAYLACLPRRQSAPFVYVFHGDNARPLCTSSSPFPFFRHFHPLEKEEGRHEDARAHANFNDDDDDDDDVKMGLFPSLSLGVTRARQGSSSVPFTR